MKKSLFRRNRGFTLAETLLAVVIVLLVSGIVASGVPMAINVYHKITDAANANVLLSTTMTELRDKLALATDLDCSAKTKLSFRGNNGRKYTLEFVSNSDVVTGLFLNDKTNDGKSDSRLLVSNAAAAKNLCADFEEVDCSNGVITFTGIKIYRKSDSEKKSPIAEIDTYKIKQLTYTPED